MSHSATPSAIAEADRVELRWGIQIALRDHVRLNATVYLPRHRDLPVPCICALTPYTTDGWHMFGMYFAARGLGFVVVDVRGRGNSEGVFVPHVREADDGHDVIEWLARQPFCNGKVGMYGSSYLGYAQWATITRQPAHLATIVPTAAPFMGVDVPMRNNVFYSFNLQWAILTGGRTLQTKVATDPALWGSVLRRWYASGRAFRDLDHVFGNRCAQFQEELNHPQPDAHWDSQNPTADDYARLQIPVLTITGAYDDEQAGALEHYRRHDAYNPSGSRQHFLIIGPWDHAGAQWPTAQIGGWACDSASVIDIRALHLDWYRWVLLGDAAPALLKKRVTYFMSGANQWRHADSLEAVTGRAEAFHVGSEGRTNGLKSVGWLKTTCESSGPPNAYIYDPRVMDDALLDAQIAAQDRWLVDQGIVRSLGARVLVYESDALPAAIEIAGFFTFQAWIALDCPDTDLYVSIHEIDPDGQSLLLSSDVMRARYRLGLRSPQLINTDHPLLYNFERFTFIARRIAPGHRLRLILSPVGRLADGIFNQKNYNGGGVVAEETATDARAVTVTLFHDADHPSALNVPIAAGV